MRAASLFSPGCLRGCLLTDSNPRLAEATGRGPSGLGSHVHRQSALCATIAGRIPLIDGRVMNHALDRDRLPRFRIGLVVLACFFLPAVTVRASEVNKAAHRHVEAPMAGSLSLPTGSIPVEGTRNLLIFNRFFFARDTTGSKLARHRFSNLEERLNKLTRNFFRSPCSGSIIWETYSVWLIPSTPSFS
jgi:hypothetical protein